MNYKYSKYNYYVEVDDKTIIANMLSGSIMVFNKLQKTLFDNYESLDQNSNFTNALIKAGYIVDSDVDENKKVLEKIRSIRNSTDNFILTIAPTMDCNFDCPYCFENHRKGKMSKKTQDQIIAFVKNCLKKYKPSVFNVSWFGGEPLLCKDIIYRLSEAFIIACEKTGTRYAASITTNGWFLTKDVSAQLNKYNIERIQVTLDGDKINHDKTRCLKGGQSTFDTIIKNLEDLKTDAKVIIRCNITHNNKQDVPKLVEIVKHLNQLHNDDSMYTLKLGHTKTDENTNCGNEFRVRQANLELMTQKEFSDLDYQLTSVFSFSLGLRQNNLCGAVMSSRYMCIDENGDLFHCQEVIGEAEYAFGNISNFNYEDLSTVTNKNVYCIFENLLENPDKKCDKCPLLPVCWGGCLLVRHRHNSADCYVLKQNMDEILINWYRDYYKC